MLPVFEPVACVFTSQLAVLVAPVGALSVAFIASPQAFVFVSVLVKLNAETLFLVVSPVANVSGRGLPLLALDGAVFLSLLLLHVTVSKSRAYLDPVDRSMRAILLGLGIIPMQVKSRSNLHFPHMGERDLTRALATITREVGLRRVKKETLL